MYLIYGDHDFLCQRSINDLRKAMLLKGFAIHTVGYSQLEEEVQPMISPMLAFMGGGQIDNKNAFIVNEGVEDADFQFVSDLEKNHSVPIVLHLRGSLPRSKKHPLHKFISTLPKKCVIQHKKPPIFKEHEVAVAFVVGEAARHKKKISSNLAEGVVKISGTNLGILSFEILKASYLAHDSKDLKPEHLRTISSLAETSALPLIESIAKKNLKEILKQFAKMRSTYHRDPTLMVCGWLGSEVCKWLATASALKKGSVNPSDLNIHPYVFQKNILPAAKKWGEKALLDLLHIISNVERYVKTGGKHSLDKLEIELMFLLTRKS